MADCKTCELKIVCEMPGLVRNDLKSCKVDEPKKKQTNADRIRSMTDEELAEFLKEYFSCEYGCPAHKTACICDCIETIIKWLQKECEV